MSRKSLAMVTAVFMAVFMIVLPCVSYAGTSAESGNQNIYGGDLSLRDRLLNVPSFKFYIHQNGIGYGSCPVFTAPSETAYRCANGKASCDTNSEIAEVGFVSGWLLVRYETNNGGYRVGYIPSRYVKGFKPALDAPKFDFIPATAGQTLYVTDNPLLQGSYFAILDPGEAFYILGKYTYHGDWWYIECTVDGQMARGFIDRGSASFSLGSADAESSGGQPSGRDSSEVFSSANDLGFPSLSPLGTPQNGMVRIENASTRVFVRKSPDPSTEWVSSAYPGRQYPCYAERIGSTGKYWYYIWIEEDSVWGWVSSGYAVRIP